MYNKIKMMHRVEHILECPQENIAAEYIIQSVSNAINLGSFIANAHLDERDICDEIYCRIVDENIALIFLAEKYEEYEIAASVYKMLLNDCKTIYRIFKKQFKYKHLMKEYIQNLKDTISESRDFYMDLIDTIQNEEYYEDEEY